MRSAPAGSVIAALRCGVGAVLLAAPDLATSGDSARRVLVRTIGIRDLVLGAGTLLAGRDEAARWTGAGLASDVGDVVVAVASHRDLGRRGTVLAALTPLPFVVSGLRTLSRG